MVWLNLLFWMSLPAILFDAFQNSSIRQDDRAFDIENFRNAYHELPSYDTTREMGKRVFQTSCYSCHNDSANTLAPGYSMLSTLTPRAILASLNQGKMKQQAAGLTEKEREAVSEWLTSIKLKPTTFQKEAYTTFAISQKGNSGFDHSGWGNNLEGTGFRTAREAGISADNVASLKLKWAFAFPDATVIRSKPAVIDNWLIVGGQFGDVFAIHRHTGKIGWSFSANAAIRGAIAIARKGNSITAYFADFATNVYALDVKSGKLLWSKRAGFETHSNNTGSVAVYGGVVYVPISSLEVGLAARGDYPCCSSSGGVVALSTETGEIIWTHRTVPPAVVSGKKKNGKPVYGPSGATVWCSPTVDAKRGLLYIGTGQNYSYPPSTTSDAIQALDLKTGKLVWNFQATKADMYNLACPVFENCPDKKSPDVDFGMAPILAKFKDGKEILVVGQKSGVVHALSPADGKLIWQTRVGKGGMLGGIHWGMCTDGNYVYVANSDNRVALDKSDSLQLPSPGIHALDLNTGKLIWKSTVPGCEDYKNCRAFTSAAPLVIPGVVFAGSLDGHMRAYDASNGKIVWDYDTNKEYESSNGIKGKGGSIDGPAPVVADGMLFVNSGYGMFGQRPGNVLLAFEIENKK
jgi:polyvinyl alcohol dehydrogenase (cytochrome)